MMQGSHASTNPVDLSVSIGKLELANPIMTASGTFGSGKEYASLVDIQRIGAIVTKGVSPVPWSGNSGPRIFETASGMLNSIGLQNPGVEAFCENDLPWLRDHAPKTTVVVNVCGHSVEEYVAVIERLEREEMVAGYELNVSCPNVDEGGMAFGMSCAGVDVITATCRKATDRPLIVKLSPNVADIATLAVAAQDAGADAVSLINTLLGMAIDIDKRRPQFQRVVAGLSGPAIKPVALRCVWQVANAVDIPVIGMGGVSTPSDVIEFMLAGASAVAVGTANFTDPTTTMQCIDGVEQYCRKHNISSVRELIGALGVAF